MRYQQEGEDEVTLFRDARAEKDGEQEQFSVTRGDGEIVLELFGGSSVGEYYTLTVEEATNLERALTHMLQRVRADEIAAAATFDRLLGGG